MEKIVEQGPFEAIELPQKQLPHLMGVRYRVYTDDTNYKLVDAGSALEAVQKSDIANPVRIKRDSIFLHRVINLSAMLEESASMNAANAKATAEAPAATPVEAAETPQAPAEPTAGN